MLRSRKISFAFLFCILAVASAHAQAQEESIGPRFTWPELPHTSYEPVTGPLQVLTSPQDRTRAFDLLDHARQDYSFYVQHGAAFSMRVSFLASGQTQYEGQGSMEETWLDNGHKTWTAQLAGNTSGRTVYLSHRWAANGSLIIPLHVQTVRAALFWPVSNFKDRADLRMQRVNFQGAPLTCILAVEKLGYPPAGRHWVEREYCVDEQTGLLRIWSEAPGIYAVYDYKSAINWNGHTIASQITFYEDGGQALQIHVESLGEASMSAAEFRPSAEILAQRSATGNGGPVRFAVIASPGPPPDHGVITPVIVHAALAANGSLLDAEVLTPVDPALAERPISAVKARCHCFTNPNEQEEALITVEFISAEQ